MNPLWKNALLTLSGAAFLALIIGLVFDWVDALASFSILLLVYFIWHLHQINRLWQMLDAPEEKTVPNAPGLWGEIWYRLERLIKRNSKQIQEKELQHMRFIAAIQASPNGVLMLDRNNCIEWCNQAAEQHFNLDAHRDRLQQVTHLLRWPEYVHYLLNEDFSSPLIMHDLDRGAQKISERPSVISVQIFPYGDSCKLQLSHDISALEHAEAMRRDFIANVSHELKNPLTVLHGFLETMHELPLAPEAQKHYLEIMQIQSSRMQHIVENLLELAKLENPMQKPAREVIDMPAMLMQLSRDAENLSQGQHTILCRCTAEFNLLGDENGIYSAFGNLVSNAVRYTPANGNIELSWVKDPTSKDMAIFSVSDNGIGIAAEHISRLTERFYCVDPSRSRDTGGSGLGLAIVKHVLARHDSKLKIESGATKGTNRQPGSTFSARFSMEWLIPDCPSPEVNG